MGRPTIHLIFKTHLDIGFTDHAGAVRRQYHERFIPQALATGEHFHAEDPDNPRFIWTTGAWLIWDHLETQDAARVARLERAIGRGLIRWHALPFTTHSELMSPALFRAGLSIGQELDRRFGVETVAAKLTDVPGHTLGIVPLLAAAGVRFLHIGVNTASPVPDVPPMFRWRAPGGEEVVVMYQGSYGATQLAPGGEVGLGFAHTNDNLGPQSVSQAVEVHRAMAHAHPEATIRASTLDAFGALMWARRAELPVVDLEIGDSWIHGAASDPDKLARFNALQRLYDRFEAEGLTPERRAFGRSLTLVAEHTWGIDVKTYLRDETAWDRSAFEHARGRDYRFAFAEASWAEQRRYLDTAVGALGEADRGQAAACLAMLDPGPALRTAPGRAATLECAGWTIACDPVTGDILRIAAPDGTAVEGRDGALMGYRYESYDAAEFGRHLDTYLQHREEWALLDQGKPGLEHARTARTEVAVPRCLGAGLKDGHPALLLEMPEAAHRELGAPRRVEIVFRPRHAERLEIAVILRAKPANRMPEASFVSFTPAGTPAGTSGGASGWTFRKTGLDLPGGRVAARGGGQLQAVSMVAAGTPSASLQLQPLDTPLVAPAGTAFMPFAPQPPDLSGGLRFNLHNNKWGTNFPMWCAGDLVARFVLTLAPAAGRSAGPRLPAA